MAVTYRTQEGDTVDLIAWRYYGTTDNGIVERLLQANEGVAENGPVLAANVRITLPELEVPRSREGLSLWD